MRIKIEHECCSCSHYWHASFVHNHTTNGTLTLIIHVFPSISSF
jgi:hypothetical protein